MSKYKKGDRFLVEVEKTIDDYGYKFKEMNASIFTETLLDRLPKLADIEEEKQAAFKEGMETAWDVAKKMYLPKKYGGLELEELMDIFNEDTFVDDLEGIFIHFSAAEAKEMIERYEAKKKIHEGDIVEILEQKAVVLAIDNGIESVYVLTDPDAKVQEVPVHKLKKEEYFVDVRRSLLSAYEIAKSFKATKIVMQNLSKEAEEASKNLIKIISGHGTAIGKVKSDPPEPRKGSAE